MSEHHSSFMAETYSSEWTDYALFIHLSVDGQCCREHRCVNICSSPHFRSVRVCPHEWN